MDPHKSFALLAIGPGESKSHQEDTIVDDIFKGNYGRTPRDNKRNSRGSKIDNQGFH